MPAMVAGFYSLPVNLRFCCCWALDLSAFDRRSKERAARQAAQTLTDRNFVPDRAHRRHPRLRRFAALVIALAPGGFASLKRQLSVWLRAPASASRPQHGRRHHCWILVLTPPCPGLAQR